MYSCNICGFTKEKFEALMEYMRPAPPDAIVLVETNLSFMMILLLLFLQKQSLAFAVYLFGIGALHTGPGLK